jgi:hypothetical protein
MEFGQADVLGFSIGSFVAQDTALIRPSVLRRLILPSSTPQGAAGMHGWAADLIDAVGVPQIDPERPRRVQYPVAVEPARLRAGNSADVRQDAGPGPADNLNHPAGPVRRGLRLGDPRSCPAAAAVRHQPAGVRGQRRQRPDDPATLLLPARRLDSAGSGEDLPGLGARFPVPAPHRVRRRRRGIPQRSGPGPRRANLLTFSTMQNRPAPLIIQAKAAAAPASPESTERPVRGGTDSRNDDRGCGPHRRIRRIPSSAGSHIW